MTDQDETLAVLKALVEVAEEFGPTSHALWAAQAHIAKLEPKPKSVKESIGAWIRRTDRAHGGDLATYTNHSGKTWCCIDPTLVQSWYDGLPDADAPDAPSAPITIATDFNWVRNGYLQAFESDASRPPHIGDKVLCCDEDGTLRWAVVQDVGDGIVKMSILPE